jgi:Domain of unknown function (DUF4262)
MTFKEEIQYNINNYGHHITTVISDLEPRYAYTIGISEQQRFELIFAGGIYYMKDEVLEIINKIADALKKLSIEDVFQINDFGAFKLSKVHPTWSNLMALGVFDFYQQKEIEVLQIVPDSEHYTMDVPNMSREWAEASEPVWKWLVKEWDYAVSKKSKVITNINSMCGEKITEVMRWEEDEWEAFVGSGDDVNKDDIRIVSLATIIGIDNTLLPILNLATGKGFWRDSVELNWNDWG